MFNSPEILDSMSSSLPSSPWSLKSCLSCSAVMWPSCSWSPMIDAIQNAVALVDSDDDDAETGDRAPVSVSMTTAPLSAGATTLCHLFDGLTPIRRWYWGHNNSAFNLIFDSSLTMNSHSERADKWLVWSAQQLASCDVIDRTEWWRHRSHTQGVDVITELGAGGDFCASATNHN